MKIFDIIYVNLILTDNGFSICEIETSPFGLGLAEVLNSTYGNQGYETIIQQHQPIHASTASINTAISYERTDNERD